MAVAIRGRIYVVGCNHGIQPEPDGPWSVFDAADAQEQRRHFATLLADIIKREKIDFVGEEGGSGEKTIAESLAERRDIPYRNINTNDLDKESMGIPCDYIDGPYTDEQKEHWHRQREQFMLERIREYRGAARNLLIVCGFDHWEQLSQLLGNEGTVRQIDYRESEWYRTGVFAGDTGDDINPRSISASAFEFRHRTWFIFGIFCVGLACYWFDPQNSGVVVARGLRSRIQLLQTLSVRSSIRSLFLIASLIVAVGAMIRTWGEAYLRADVAHDSSVRTERLVADGPFRYTRNPLYFGALVGVFGAGLLCSRAGWIVQMTLAILFCYRLILREERELFRAQGERFLAYCRAVPRLLPAFKPRLPTSGGRPRWRESFAGQTPWWGAAAAEVAYAATLRLGFAISVAVAGFAIFVTQKYLLKSYARPVAVPKEMR